MSISKRVIKSLLPMGLIWQVAPGTNFAKFIAAVGACFDIVKTWLDAIRDQAFPDRATDTYLLREWSDAYRINQDLTEAERQALAKTYYTSVGGQDYTYFSTRLQDSGFLADVFEPIIFVHHASSCCGGAMSGVAQSGGNGGNCWIYYKGYNEGTTRFYRSGGSSDIPIPGNTTLTSATSSLQYRTTGAATLLAGQSYIDVKVRTTTVATGLALLAIDEVLVLDTPITDIYNNTEVQNIAYLENYSYEVIHNLVEYIKPVHLTVFYVPSFDLNRDYYLAVGAVGDIRKFDESAQTWAAKASGTLNTLRAIHGTDDGSFIVACGDSGTVIYSLNMGETWAVLGSFPDTIYDLTSCWVLSSTEVWISGSRTGYGQGKAWVWNGSVWTESVASSSYWNSIAALSGSSIYSGVNTSVGYGIWHYNGTWTGLSSTDSIESIYPDSQDGSKIYAHSNAASGYSRLWYGNLSGWSIQHSNAYVHGESYGRSLWVDEAGEVWMCGSDGAGNAVIRSWNGSLSTEFSKFGTAFSGIYGRSSESILVTGVASGATNYDTYYYDGNSWTQVQITGSAHEMIAVWAPAV